MPIIAWQQMTAMLTLMPIFLLYSRLCFAAHDCARVPTSVHSLDSIDLARCHPYIDKDPYKLSVTSEPSVPPQVLVKDRFFLLKAFLSE